MLRSTWTVFGASSALAACGFAERGKPRAKPPSMTTAVSSAVVRSLVGRITMSLLSLHDDECMHLVGVETAGHGVGAGRDLGGLVVVARTGEATARGGATRPLVAWGDEVRARRERLV